MKKTLRILLPVLLLSLLLLPALQPSARAAADDYVRDYADLLTDAEEATLEQQAADLAARYGCGVYVLTVEDYRALSNYSDVFYYADDYYYENRLGVGANRDGHLLVLSMADRSYAVFAFGAAAEDVFSLEAQDDVIKPAFLPYFRGNDWYGGFGSYVAACRGLLEKAANGQYYQRPVNYAPRIALSLAISAAVAFIVVFIMKSQMKSAVLQKDANAYVIPGSLYLNSSSDQFTHVTEVRQMKETERSGGGGGGMSGSHGGGHGSSGHF